MGVMFDFFWLLIQAMAYCVILFWGLAFSAALAVGGVVLLIVLRQKAKYPK